MTAELTTTALLPCPFCGHASIKFGNETTCECDNKECGIYHVAVEVDLWQVRKVVHDADCAIALNGRHACSCKANATAHRTPGAETTKKGQTT